MSVPDDILLGDGVFSMGDTSTSLTTVALTRGGGKFTVEREFRKIEADGDFGNVKGRIRLIREVPKLNMKNLEIVAANADDYFPSITATTSTATTTFTSRSFTANVSTSDYKYVKWAGYTKGGDAVLIHIENAINLENIEWEMVDKEEVINELTYEGCFLETSRNTAVWEVSFAV